jgi:eukaryotic-like serine/threonine-protein kinase
MTSRPAEELGPNPTEPSSLRVDAVTPTISASDPQVTGPYGDPSTRTGQPEPETRAEAGTGSDPFTIPGYEVLGVLGRGGMGIVYQARQLRLKRLVALKMVRDTRTAGPQEQDRFRVEAEAVARLQHPNVVQIFEVGEAAGQPFFALEYVEGGSLANKLGGTPLPAREAAQLAGTIARAVQAAHAQGVIHRDLKPANVLLTKDGVPKITDFGLAKRLDADSGQTQMGQVLGTPSYMAPEQARGDTRAGAASTDVYALGAILYEMLTGRPPFKGASVVETLEQVRTQEPVPPTRLQPRCPRDVETICLKCLQKDPQRRYPGCEALADDLRRFLAGEPIRARPVSRVERAWRWCRRNPRVAAMGATVAVLLILVAISLGVLAVRLSQERQAVAETRRVAEQRLQQAIEAVAGGNYLRAQDLLRWSDPVLDRHADLGDIRSELDTLKAQVDVYAQFKELLDAARFACRFGSRQQKELGRGYCVRLLGLYDAIEEHQGRAAAGLPSLNAEQQQLFKEDVFEAFLTTALVDMELTASAGPEAQKRAARQAIDWLDRAEKVLPGSHVLYVSRAPFWGKLGNSEANRADMERARAIKPTSAVDHFWVGVDHYVRGEENLKRGDADTAREDYRKGVVEYAAFLRLRPDHFWGYFNWGVCQAQLGDLHNALVGFTSCIRLRPDHPWSYNNRGTVHLRLGEPDLAVRDYDAALVCNPQYVEGFVNRSAAYLALGKTDQALEDAQQALTLNPDHAPGYLQRAEVYRCRKRLDEALKDCDRAVALDSTSLQAYQARALLRYGSGDYLRARGDFSRMIELAPHLADAYRNLAIINWLHLKDFDASLKDFARFAQLRPTDPDPHRCIGAILLGRRQYGPALEALKKSLDLRPDYPPAVWCRAQILLWCGKPEEALKGLDSLVARLPEGPPETLNVRADVYQAMGRLEKASADYSRMIELMPKEPAAYVNLALVYLKQGRPEMAAACLDRLVAAAPESEWAYLRRAEYRRDQGNYDQALADCGRAEQLKPGWALAALVRASIGAARGQASAVAEAERALEKAPKHDGQVLYTAACVWSLASRTASEPGDARRAADLLAEALDKGFHDLLFPTHNRMAEDPALAPIRQLPGVRDLLAHKP